MSCESRHRAIVTDLLALAGLRDTVDADTVMDVGVANRRRRGGLPTTDAAMTVSLHADAQHALEITVHSDQVTPAWVAALIDRLHTAADRGNRRALLTMRWLTEGWDAVTPLLAERDRGWLLAAAHCGIQVPPAWEAWTTYPRPAAIIGRLLPYPVVKGAVVHAEVLDALIGIDDVPPVAAQTVTPLQVVRLLFGGSFPSRTDLQRVLRAVLDDASIVRETVTQVKTFYDGGGHGDDLLHTLIGCATHAHTGSVEQTGINAVLMRGAAWIRDLGGPPIDPAALCDPSPMVVAEITNALQGRGLRLHLDQAILSLAILMHTWRAGGWTDAVEEMTRSLKRVLDGHRYEYLSFLTTVPLIVSGAVRPPHGDVLLTHLVYDTIESNWSALVAGAVYAAACHQIGHVPVIDGIEGLIRTRWQTRQDITTRSAIPLLAVGRERELLLPAIHAARGTGAWFQMLLDCIDAVDVLDMVGGNPQELLAVLTDELSIDGRICDPQIVVRLAASRYGQALLADIPRTALPRWVNKSDLWAARRLIPHLVSPWWATAPPRLREWCKRTMKRVVARNGGTNFVPPPPYPTVWSQAAVAYPHSELVEQAVADAQWATLSDADRRACLTTLFRSMGRVQTALTTLAVAIRAATDTTLHDVATVVAETTRLSAADVHALHWIIGSQPRRSA